MIEVEMEKWKNLLVQKGWNFAFAFAIIKKDKISGTPHPWAFGPKQKGCGVFC